MITFNEAMIFTSGVSGNAAFEEPECEAYYNLLKDLTPNSTVVEIGLQYGRSSSIVLQLQREIGFDYYGVDPFTDPPEAMTSFSGMAKKTGGAIRVMLCKSSDVLRNQTFHFPTSVDICLIDGDHSAEGVSSDIRLMAPRIRHGGYLLFHDYGGESLPGVWDAVHSYMKSPGSIGMAFRQLPTVGTLGIFRRV